MSADASHAGSPFDKFKGIAQEVVKAISHESESEAHQIFRAHPGHGGKQDVEKEEKHLPGIEHPGSTGVIYVTDRAMSNGFHYGNPEWANLGQGAPEVGEIPGSVSRPKQLDLEQFGENIHEYAPNTGIPELRKAVANYYNETFRKAYHKKFTAANVCIVPGGRAGMTRLAAVTGAVNFGYQRPDYSSYQQMLESFKLVPIPSVLSEAECYKFSADEMAREIKDRGLSAMILSNPRNPTGTMIEGEELKRIVELSKELGCTFLLDEFYSWYMHEGPLGRANSAAEFIDDINDTPVVIIDGLTKGWRLPGWRVCWVVGSEDIITALNESGSFLDGGTSHPMQCLALQMLDVGRCNQDRMALQTHFRAKRKHVLDRLAKMGLAVKVEPQATFYIWLSLASLPPPLNSGLVMFEELLREKTIVVPGIAFDINPAHRRNIISSPCEPYIRVSYGPPLDQVDRGLDALERVIAKARPDQAGKHRLNSGYVRTRSSHLDPKSTK
ncbi:hypothetical protein ACQY0O_005761 [Thecaphora frezii]